MTAFKKLLSACLVTLPVLLAASPGYALGGRINCYDATTGTLTWAFLVSPTQSNRLASVLVNVPTNNLISQIDVAQYVANDYTLFIETDDTDTLNSGTVTNRFAAARLSTTQAYVGTWDTFTNGTKTSSQKLKCSQQ
ncbi:MAG: hypothetical protein C5B49_08370 [Bdellovibrio sp.]|nr:MAG: hypothetical protein C5B49_08370 [Bdellovibrio sp.]